MDTEICITLFMLKYFKVDTMTTMLSAGLWEIHQDGLFQKAKMKSR